MAISSFLVGVLAMLAVAYAGFADAAKCRFVKIVEWQIRPAHPYIVVEGAINGQKVGIVLDTGATLSLVLRSTATRLDLPRIEATGRRVYGVGGQSRLEIANVDDFRLGEVPIRDMQLYVAGEGDLVEGVDVLLGEDFLSKFDIEFDLKNGAVRLFRPTDCEGVSLVYWTRENVGEVEIEHVDTTHPRISLTVEINGKPTDAILDSAAPGSVMTTKQAAAAGVTPDTVGVVAGHASGGLGAKTVESWIGPFQTFAIGNESIPDIKIRFADLYKDSTYTHTGSRVVKKVSGTEPMLLGADFLRSHRTLVSHSQRILYFTYTGGPVFRAIPAATPPTSSQNAK